MKTSATRMHVSMYVKDLDQTLDFYRNFFDLQPVKVKNDYAKFVLSKPDLIISFVENPSRVQSGFGHLGFQVETQEKLNQYLTKAQKMNLVTLEEIGTSCCYAVQDKFWVTDPDGVKWEVYYFHEDSEFNDPRYASDTQDACCTPQPKTKKSLRDLTPSSNCC